MYTGMGESLTVTLADKLPKGILPPAFELSLSFFFFFFGLFKAVPEARGGSQARGQIEPVAAGLRHSTLGSKPHL